MNSRLVVVVTALLAAVVSPALAKDMTGKVSLGFHNSDAPLGGRYWINNQVGIDVGLGFKSNEKPDADPETQGKTVTTFSYWFEGGLPFKLYDTDNAHFYAKPSFIFGMLDDRDYGTGTSDAKWTSLDLVLSLGAEVFFGEHFSLDATHGVKFNVTSVPDEVKQQVGADSFTSFSTFGENLTTIGFHFYF